ncbi:hypothetical protein BU25DRAFT_411284 [Macroventuria anomochaeta]|uniref:Uncharacterized protein n=1 Tax=Macroventuria anomochaeta TaxID=301207 RepID=A0ACB6S201_9PLEO|nr:uncharacterized protein BU25DRAFT_411284 [Macroventuria anomochaeta]KAF2627234.1 hypothetical protein BU25DRAFT_411284 [Macroventuria anomochaeta]
MLEAQTPADMPLPTPKPSRPKAIGPTKRRKVTPAVVPEILRKLRPATATTTHQSPYDDTLSASTTLGYLQPQMAVCNPTVVELPPTRDELPQPIVSKYEDYKWSVYHYELLPKGYDFAERWLQALFATTLQSEYHDRHLSHVSQGFIKDGGRHSLLVLHNAANPFKHEPTPDSTITIGAYGYHWYRHNEIHWTTLASDQRSLLAQCVQAGFLEEKHKWTFDAEKATEKRFHRAYWLAANRRDLKDLLNRGPSDDKPHDLSGDKSEEDPDKDFSISEADLTNEWHVTGSEAAAAWQRVQDEVDALGDGFDAYGEGWQHVVTSNSEWSFSR